MVLSMVWVGVGAGCVRGQGPKDFPAFPGYDDPEGILKEWLRMREAAVGLLKDVKDKATAEAAVGKLRPLGERHQELDFVLADKQIAKSLKSWANYGEIRKKYQDRVNQREKNLDQEYARLLKQPDIISVLRDSFPIKDLDIAKANSARLFMREGLFPFLNNFRAATGRYPENWEELLAEKGTLLKKEALTDPWGRPYQYDPAGPMHHGRMPDIWSLGPPHGDSRRIGNWSDGKQSDRD
jgi:hypothetical protein